MASRHEIKCINKSDRPNPHERITRIGGVNPDGKNWYLDQQEAVQAILANKWHFFVNRGGQAVNVVVATSRYGNQYLKTEADGEQPNNLLSLFECVR